MRRKSSKVYLSIDTQDDLEKANWIISQFTCKPRIFQPRKFFSLVKIWKKSL